jgi:hypothetical protein
MQYKTNMEYSYTVRWKRLHGDVLPCLYYLWQIKNMKHKTTKRKRLSRTLRERDANIEFMLRCIQPF